MSKLLGNIFRNKKLIVFPILIAGLALTIAACDKAVKSKSAGGDGKKSNLSGTVKSDGSSTVFPIMEAVGEEFQKDNPNVKVTVGLSGTGGGFKKFVVGETDISNASRPIKPEELEQAKANGVEYIELTLAYDGLSVMVNPANDFVKDITTDELKKIWNAGSTVKTWKDVRGSWSDEEIKLFGPGTDSGTFDFFTEKINGKEDVSRADFTASEDDNVLVQGIAGEENAMGYFGYAYYVENKDKLKLLSVNGVLPDPTSIRDGSYKPLSRPLFIYINKKALDRKEVKEFAKFCLENGAELSEQVGYIPLPDEEYTDQMAKLDL